MDLRSLKKVHIIGIAGSASSAVALLLLKNGIKVTGSEMKERNDLNFLIDNGVNIVFGHKKENINGGKDIPEAVLYSPAVTALNKSNPELIEAERLNIPCISWQEFFGKYLFELGMKGITVSGSEGKGTTAGILTSILKDTAFDPLALLGAKLKDLDGLKNTNIYFGAGKSYILEADEYNRNFLNYRPAMNIMINFQYEHPETYPDFYEYKKAFNDFYKNMTEEKTLIFRATENTIALTEEYDLKKTHKVIFFKNENDELSKKTNAEYFVTDHVLSPYGNKFILNHKGNQYDFYLPYLPGYMVNNSTGAIIAALELGLPVELIKKNILKFKGMVRRFDVIKTKKNFTFITDYGHSPESISHIVKEIRNIYPGKKIHLVFQPHLFSRTYNFFKEFVNELSKADKITLVDIYPARENKEEWQKKISSEKLYYEIKKLGKDVFYSGEVSRLFDNMINKVDQSDINCFMGAGDMDQYYNKIFEYFDS